MDTVDETSVNPIDAFLNTDNKDVLKTERQAEFDASKASIDQRYVRLFTVDQNTNNSDDFQRLTGQYWSEIFSLYVILARRYVNRLYFVDLSAEDQAMLLRAKLYEIETAIRL